MGTSTEDYQRYCELEARVSRIESKIGIPNNKHEYEATYLAFHAVFTRKFYANSFLDAVELAKNDASDLVSLRQL